MNNEIKEIFSYFIKYMSIKDCMKIKKLEDYITNLNNKIEKAVELYQTCKEEDWCTLPIDMVNILQDGVEKQMTNENIIKEQLEDYKSRCEEVIEYIKSLCYIESKNEWFTYGDDLNPKYIVNVLQNGCEANDK